MYHVTLYMYLHHHYLHHHYHHHLHYHHYHVTEIIKKQSIRVYT